MDTIAAFKRQIELANEVDTMEMRNLHKMLLFHGVAEQRSGVTAQVIAGVMKQNFQMPEFTIDNI